MEDQITLFFVQLVTILQCARSLPTLEWREKALFAAQIILARLAFEFRRCRPEQFWCYEEGRKVTSVSFVSISIFIAILPIAILTFKVSFNYLRSCLFLLVLVKNRPFVSRTLLQIDTYSNFSLSLDKLADSRSTVRLPRKIRRSKESRFGLASGFLFPCCAWRQFTRACLVTLRCASNNQKNWNNHVCESKWNYYESGCWSI